MSEPHTPHYCGLCGIEGHNVRTCTAPGADLVRERNKSRKLEDQITSLQMELARERSERQRLIQLVHELTGFY